MSADQVDHRNAAEARFEHVPADAGLLRREIGRAQDALRFFHIGDQLALAPGVVAHGDHIRAGVEDFLGLPGQQPQNGGVFPVDHTKIDLFLPLQAGEGGRQIIQTGGGDHITDGEQFQLHDACPL